MGTERLELLQAERLAPDSPLLQALMKIVLSTAGSVEKWPLSAGSSVPLAYVHLYQHKQISALIFLG